MILTSSESDYELCVDQRTWLSALAALIDNPSQVAVGTVLVEKRQVGIRLVVHDVLLVNHCSGQERPMLDSWCVMAMQRPGDDRVPLDPAAAIARFAPRFSQHFTLLIVGIGPHRAGWIGWTAHRASLRQLESFRSIGAGGFEIGPRRGEQTPDFFATELPLRWSRVERAIGAGFSSVRGASVAIVGCSRSGTLAATQFAALGVRHLTLIDGDTVEAHNLDGMFLATPSDVGKTKASSLATRLSHYRPDMSITVVERPFAIDGTLESASQWSLLVTCVDNDIARDHVSRLANRRLIPHLDIGTEVLAGNDPQLTAHADVRFLFPKNGCMSCIGGNAPSVDSDFEAWSIPGSLAPQRAAAWHEQRLGSLITINATAVSSGIQTWLASIRGHLPASIWHRLAWRTDGSLSIESASVVGDNQCTICR